MSSDSASQPTSVSPASHPSALKQALRDVQARPNTNIRRNSPQSGAPTAVLSCELCRTRKIKCDKADGGCSNCKKAGVKCIALNRQRLPRGRNGGRKKADAELKIRVGRLENLVRTLEAGQGDESEHGMDEAVRLLLANGPDVPTREDEAMFQYNKQGSPSRAMRRYLGSSFWSGLSEEVNGLREVLDDESEGDDDDGDIASPQQPDVDMSGGTPYSFVFCGPNNLIVSPEASQHPPQFMIEGLCAIFERRVVPLFNIIHYPALRGFLRERKPYFHYPPGHPATEALSFAVYFAAAAAQTDDECMKNFGEPQGRLAGNFRFKLEAALSRADFINTKDITVLQAFMMHLLCLRALNNGRSTWTLLSLAVRIAQAMGLHEDDAYNLPPFQHEIRRRVWNGLCILDLQATRDRGSNPLIPSNSFSTPPPLNVPDEDLTPEMTIYPETKEGLFDISLNVMSGFAARVGKQLDHVQRGQPLEIEQNWEKRQELAVSFKERFDRNIGRHLDLRIEKHIIVAKIAETIASGLTLSAVRPLHRHPRSKPPQVSTKSLLDLTSSILERIASGSNIEAYRDVRWFGTLYNQWHAVAVMAASLCVETKGPSVDRAWAIVEPSLVFFKSTVADSENGMLWRPIEKLMKRAREVRAAATASRSSSMPSLNASMTPSTASGGLESSTSQPDMGMLSLEPTQTWPQQMPASDFSLFDTKPNTTLGPGLMPMPGAQWNEWSPDMGNFDLRSGSTSSESPSASWANWENFIQDLDQNADAPFDMPLMDPSWNSQFPGTG